MKYTHLLFALLIGALATSHAGELVVNGGFETILDGGEGPSIAPGWTFQAAPDGSDFHYDGAPLSGSNAASFGGTTSGSYDIISQVIPTTPGTLYTFSFWLNAGSGEGLDNGEIVSWDGTQVLHLTNFVQDYTFYHFNVSASTENTTISFAGYNTPDWNNLDDVSVGSGVPEPASFLLLAPALIGLAALRRKFGK